MSRTHPALIEVPLVMSLRSPSPNRRAVLASLGAAVPAVAIAAPGVVIGAIPALATTPDHPDAALLALRPAVLAALAVEEPLRAEDRRIRKQAETNAGPEPKATGWTPARSAWNERREAERKALGGSDAFDRWNEASNRLHDIMDQMAEIPATTLDGLRFKALAVERDEIFAERIVADLLAMGGHA